VQVQRWRFVLVIAALAIGVIVVLVAGQRPDTSAADYVARQMPDPQGYTHVLLPSTAPPVGAMISVASYADPERDGQGISFNYNGVTIQACSYAPQRARRTTCKSQDSVPPLRRIKDGDFVTLFFASHKPGIVPDKTARAAMEFFLQSPTRTKPRWLADYARTALEKSVE
jgi:hypothetical protein